MENEVYIKVTGLSETDLFTAFLHRIEQDPAIKTLLADTNEITHSLNSLRSTVETLSRPETSTQSLLTHAQGGGVLSLRCLLDKNIFHNRVTLHGAICQLRNSWRAPHEIFDKDIRQLDAEDCKAILGAVNRVHRSWASATLMDVLALQFVIKTAEKPVEHLSTIAPPRIFEGLTVAQDEVLTRVVECMRQHPDTAAKFMDLAIRLNPR